MNNIIKELAEQAGVSLTKTGIDGNGYKFEYTDQNQLKFAKLIVRECVQVAGDNACSPSETPNPNIGMAKLEVVKEIIRHFGVK